MADIAEVFRILKDFATGEGLSPDSTQEGDDPTGRNGLIGFSFKDQAGDVVLPQLDAQGRLPVTLDATGTNLKATGTVVGNLSLTTVASIGLVAGQTYFDIKALVACFQACEFQIILSDNGAETIIAYGLVGPGQFSLQMGLDLFVTAGGSGPQLLLVKGQNLRAPLSDMYATIVAVN